MADSNVVKRKRGVEKVDSGGELIDWESTVLKKV